VRRVGDVGALGRREQPGLHLVKSGSKARSTTSAGMPLPVSFAEAAA
jgi:hypothetical protein